ncbi:histidine kinase [Micromonospora polyrhachis]|uniref:histidine kinase n=1 Tax=Micromonospora polyrhachis TaxID=1282883 RepID=A0A7W7WQV2_9ACTN|nr:sensor domain-containing protein [Micromonospora polyrhachis]MBB4960214.1 signal transduction histidine kinase [Micromonospora polyrhachis]
MTSRGVRHHLIAVARGLALAGVALTGAVAFLAQLAVFVPGFGLGLIFLLPRPVEWGRHLPNLARRLAHRWSGIPVAVPYRPRPSAPRPEPDGRYRHLNKLYRSPRFPAFSARLDWLLGDGATYRDLTWMALNTVVGGVLGALPAGLVVGGLGVAAGGAWYAAARAGAYWWAVPAGLVGAVVGVATAPALVALHGRWTALLLRPTVSTPRSECRKAWIGRHLLVLVRLLYLLALALLGVLLAVLTVLVMVLGFGVGQVYLLPPIIEMTRWLTGYRRELLGKWSGVAVETPYRPEPELPAPRPDGLYQVDDHLYETARWAAYNQRLKWLNRDPATWRDMLWLVTDPLVGGATLLLPFGLIWYGLISLTVPGILRLAGVDAAGQSWLFSTSAGLGPMAMSGLGPTVVAGLAIPVGLALALLGVLVAPSMLRLHHRWTRLLLAPTRRAQLALRVQRLTETRADATEAQAVELRRIERDLHDGAQARLVAVGLTLGAVEQLMDQDPAAARALLAEARESSAKALAELRDLVRGIHPPVLAERGLGDAIRALALDLPITTEVTVEVPGRLVEPIESAAYFAVSELLTNAVKHARASRITVDLRYADGRLRAVVTDDGRGGADPAAGSGLRGVERRLGTFDGVVVVSSPPGGPTAISLELPCVLSSPKTSTS